MLLNGVDNRVPVISVKFVPGALQGQQPRLRKSFRQCHPVRVRQDRVFCAVDDERRDAHFIEPAIPALTSRKQSVVHCRKQVARSLKILHGQSADGRFVEWMCAAS